MSKWGSGMSLKDIRRYEMEGCPEDGEPSLADKLEGASEDNKEKVIDLIGELFHQLEQAAAAGRALEKILNEYEPDQSVVFRKYREAVEKELAADEGEEECETE